MEEIKTNRINGFLSLNHYFFEKLGREFIDLEDLYINGLIEYEVDGLSDKFWILSDSGERIALYKEEVSGDNGAYTELLVEEIAHIMDIPAAHYDLAMFGVKKGVISYNFLKNANSNYSGFDVISEFYENKLENDPELSSLYNIDYNNDTIDDVCDKLNNLQDIWCILEERFKDEPNKTKKVKNIMEGLVNKLMLDVVVGSFDSHCDNWKIVDDKSVSPVFDNSRSLGLQAKYMKTNGIKDSTLLFTVDNENINKPLEVLNYFIKISSSEYKDMFVEKVNKLKDNYENIPSVIEKRTECSMPENLKQHFLTIMTEHLESINQVVNSKRSIK